MSETLIQDDTLAGEPVVERIRANIVESLRELTTAGGQYANAVVYELVPANPPAIVDYGLTVLTESPEGDPDNTTIGGLAAWNQPFDIYCTVVQPETSSDSIERRLNRIRADVEKKLREDPKRGRLASDTKILSPIYQEVLDTGSFGIVIVRCNVQYQVYEDDPYAGPALT